MPSHSDGRWQGAPVRAGAMVAAPSNRKGRLVVRLDPVFRDDLVVGVEATDGTENVCLATRSARVLIFPVTEANVVAGAAQGVTAIKLDAKDRVIGFALANKKREGSDRPDQPRRDPDHPRHQVPRHQPWRTRLRHPAARRARSRAPRRGRAGAVGGGNRKRLNKPINPYELYRRLLPFQRDERAENFAEQVAQSLTEESSRWLPEPITPIQSPSWRALRPSGVGRACTSAAWTRRGCTT